MLNKYLILAVLLVFAFSSGHAQKKGSDVEIIEFDNDGNESVDSEQLGFIIKTNPLSYLFGRQFIEVEKPITDFFSVQGGFGLTFASLSSDIYAEIQSTIYEEQGDCQSDVYQDDFCDDIYDPEIRDQKIGVVFNTYARLFFDDDAPDGGYFALALRYSTRNFDVQDIVQGANSLIRTPDSFQSESERNIDIVGHYGYQYLFTTLSAEYFVGMGARFSKQNKQDIGRIGNSYVATIEPLKRVNYRFELGLRIGFQL